MPKQSKTAREELERILLSLGRKNKTLMTLDMKTGEYGLLPEMVESILAWHERQVKSETKNIMAYVEQFIEDMGHEFFGKDWAKNEIKVFRRLVKLRESK